MKTFTTTASASQSCAWIPGKWRARWRFTRRLPSPYIAQAFGDRRFQMMAALETLASASFVAVSGAYFDVQQNASDALLKVLDAELSATNLTALLERVLVVTAGIFGANVGVVLLADPESNKLRVRSSTGMSPDLARTSRLLRGRVLPATYLKPASRHASRPDSFAGSAESGVARAGSVRCGACR